MQSNLVFDYQDKIYNSQNPLTFLIIKEVNDALRKSFFLFNEKERFIINEIIIKEKSLTNTAITLNINEQDLKQKLDSCLEILYLIFKDIYY